MYSNLDLESSRLTSLSAVHSPLIVLGISRSEHNPVRGAAGSAAECRTEEERHKDTVTQNWGSAGPRKFRQTRSRTGGKSCRAATHDSDGSVLTRRSHCLRHCWAGGRLELAVSRHTRLAHSGQVTEPHTTVCLYSLTSPLSRRRRLFRQYLADFDFLFGSSRFATLHTPFDPSVSHTRVPGGSRGEFRRSYE